MANRSFNRKQALEKEVKELYANVSIGGTGACTLNSSPGIASITRNSAGNYSIVLQDSYASLKMFEVVQILSSAQDLSFQLIAESVASTKILNFVCLTGASATDPTSGSKLLIKIDVKNTTVL